MLKGTRDQKKRRFLKGEREKEEERRESVNMRSSRVTHTASVKSTQRKKEREREKELFSIFFPIFFLDGLSL